MDDYFQAMFGSAAEDPLKKLEAKEREAHQAPAKPEAPVSAELLLKAEQSKALPVLATAFAEPEIKKGHLSPLIIPAAFPKLAPAALQKPVDVLTKPAVVKKDVLDKKTALSILLKQKDRLSKTQKLKLKEKLKQLEARKVATPQTDISVNTHSPPAKEALASVTTNVAAASAIEIVSKTSQLKPATIRQEKLGIADAPETLLNTNPAPEQARLPVWSEKRFECLLFSVAGLKLAVPLISLGAIYKIEKEFTPLVGRAPWFMGLYQHLKRNVRVVDTAQWVMPERCDQRVRENYKFIIRLGDSDWGIACDAVHQSIQLYPDQVKWRSERTKRVWLFGTVIDHMCALIDADALNSLLEQQAPTNISH
jgi:purine-binding chemotaxis protein CheW